MARTLDQIVPLIKYCFLSGLELRNGSDDKGHFYLDTKITFKACPTQTNDTTGNVHEIWGK
jgi:hypothetical protein